MWGWEGWAASGPRRGSRTENAGHTVPCGLGEDVGYFCWLLSDCEGPFDPPLCSRSSPFPSQARPLSPSPPLCLSRPNLQAQDPPRHLPLVTKQTSLMGATKTGEAVENQKVPRGRQAGSRHPREGPGGLLGTPRTNPPKWVETKEPVLSSSKYRSCPPKMLVTREPTFLCGVLRGGDFRCPLDGGVRQGLPSQCGLPMGYATLGLCPHLLASGTTPTPKHAQACWRHLRAGGSEGPPADPVWLWRRGMEGPQSVPLLGTTHSPQSKGRCCHQEEEGSGQRKTQVSLPASWLKAGFRQQLSYLENEASVGCWVQGPQMPQFPAPPGSGPSAPASGLLHPETGCWRQRLACRAALPLMAASGGLLGQGRQGCPMAQSVLPPSPAPFPVLGWEAPLARRPRLFPTDLPQLPAESWAVTHPALESGCQPRGRHPGPGLGTRSQGPSKCDVNSERDRGQGGAHSDPHIHKQVQEDSGQRPQRPEWTGSGRRNLWGEGWGQLPPQSSLGILGNTPSLARPSLLP